MEIPFSFILKSMVFILRRPCGSEGSTDRKPGPDGLWCSCDQSGRQLRSWMGESSVKRLQETPLRPLCRHDCWPANSARVPKQAEEGNLSIVYVLQCLFKTWGVSQTEMSGLISGIISIFKAPDVVQGDARRIFLVKMSSKSNWDPYWWTLVHYPPNVLLFEAQTWASVSWTFSFANYGPVLKC